MNTTNARRLFAAGGAAVILALASGCGSSGNNSSAPPSKPSSGSSSTPPAASNSAKPGGTGDAVLPVTSNPIQNNSTTKDLKIDSVLVENNVGADGKDTDDHLEIAVTNTGTKELSGFEVYYTFTDPKTSDTESYYAKLPADFTIAPGSSRTIHFDNTGAADHFAVNKFSLYYTDTNALDITVEVSAVDAAPQTATVKKDAGGAEQAD